MGDRQKTVGVLTGGGDVPGLNPALKTLVTRAVENGYRVLGIRRGWGGLLAYNRDDPHSGESALLFVNQDGIELCGKCHDWQKHSTHPIGETRIDPRNKNLTLECSSCHRAGSSRTRVKLAV